VCGYRPIQFAMPSMDIERGPKAHTGTITVEVWSAALRKALTHESVVISTSDPVEAMLARPGPKKALQVRCFYIQRNFSVENQRKSPSEEMPADRGKRTCCLRFSAPRNVDALRPPSCASGYALSTVGLHASPAVVQGISSADGN
jgi:hypothetical protein